MDGNDHERGIVLPTFGTQNLKRRCMALLIGAWGGGQASSNGVSYSG